MLVLGVDTSTPQVAVAIGDRHGLRGEVRLVGERRHAEQLAPAVQYLCHELSMRLGEVSAIAVGIGPGLFTGLRVGVTTAMVMAQALRLPVVGVPSLDLVAFPLRHAGRDIAVAIDARRGEVFHARYTPVPGGVQRVGDYGLATPADLVAELGVEGEALLLAGDGVARYEEHFSALEHAERAGAEFCWPSVSALVELAVGRVEREEFCTPWELRPLYLRESDAHIEWERHRP